jgi:hypothetical protein
MFRTRRPLRATVTVTALCLLAAVPAAEAAAKRPLPDLRISTAKATTVAPGAKATLSITLRNEGRAKAGATTTRISIGASPKSYTKGDKVLTSVRQPAVRGGKRASSKAKVTVPRQTAKRNIVACADGGRRVRESAEGDNCVLIARVGGTEPVAPVAGAGGNALAKPKPTPGPIVSAPTKAPPVGPSKDPATHCVSHTGAQVPTDADLAANFNSKVATLSKVTFWWPKSRSDMKSTADDLAFEMDKNIDPKLTQLMGHEPLSDAGLDCAHGTTGGVDVYLVDKIDTPWNVAPPAKPGSQGTTTPYTCNAKAPNPSYIYLARRTKETLAHEYFHVLQNTFAQRNGCEQPPWLQEGTAEWAVEFVYPHSLKDEPASAWLQAYEPPLNDAGKSYDSWPFWYDIQKRVNAKAVAGIFPLLKDKDALEAVDTAIDGFAKRWHQFARDAYNHSIVETYQTAAWTQTTWKVEKTEQLLILFSNEQTRDVAYPGSRSIKPLARTYDDYTFTSNVRKITIADLPTSADYKLHALLKMADGSWKERDLTGGATFCRDKPEENIQEMVLIASNASMTTAVTSGSKVTLDATCDMPHYRVVSASFNNHTSGGMGGTGQPCGSVSGTEDLGGSLAGSLTDPDFKLTREHDGDLDAGIFFDVDTSGTRELIGCTDPWDRRDPCIQQRPNGKFNNKEMIGFRIEVDHLNPSVARLHWVIEEASIGYFDADDTVCNVYEFYNHVDLADQYTEIPVEQIKRGTHTFTNAGTKTWQVDQKTGKPAELLLDWSYTITLQVLDKDGNPIP